MSFMDIMNKSDDLNIDKFKISMTMACGFIAVDLLIISVGYVGLYGGSIPLFADSEQAVLMFIVTAIVTSLMV